MGRLHCVQQRNGGDLNVGVPQLVCHLVGKHATETPPAQNDRPTIAIVFDFIQVGGGTFVQSAFQTLHTVDGNFLGQAAHQRLIHYRGATGWVE